MFRKVTSRVLSLSCLLIATVSGSPAVHGGVGPENVVVVVNGDSLPSKTIANHFIEIRKIPSSNVVVLEDVPADGLKISLEQFKTKILSPILEQLNQRGLGRQVRVIAYSAGFPTSVDITAHTKRLSDPQQLKYQTPTASLTGLTFLYRFVLADQPEYLGWVSNFYSRGQFKRHFANPFSGENQKRFAAAEQAFSENRMADAAAEFEQLFDEHSLPALALRAAEARARAGETDAAVILLKKSLQAGWWSRTYLNESEPLKPLLSHADLQPLLGRLIEAPTLSQYPVGFRGDVGWTVSGDRATEGINYLMSCMLAVVHPRGSTVEQAVAVLDRAAQGDLTHPDAPFWFTLTKDVRTRTRFPMMGDALLWLESQGRSGEILHAAMPNRSGRCAGLMLGTATMDLPSTRWTFVPGAIADNLTSTSAAFGGDSQTKITELLHAGAAMTCGPVWEPYSIPFKFPAPMMYGYYATGVTSIEAFYLSISSPYQLLIVGDPLCQPYARPPKEWFEIALADEPPRQIQFLRKTLRITTPHTRANHAEFFIEGKLVQAAPASASVALKVEGETSGHLHVRGVFVGDEPTEPRAGYETWLDLRGPLESPVAVASEPTADAADARSVTLRCPGADSIKLLYHARTVGTVAGESGTVVVKSASVGAGPVRLRPVARFGEQRVPGKPLTVQLSGD